MATVQEFTITQTAGEAIAGFRRLKLSSTPGQVLMADAADGDNWFAVSNELGAASGAPCTCILRSPHRTYKMEASGAVANGAMLFPADDGKVDDAVTKNAPVGFARGDTAASGEIVEVLPIPTAGDAVVLSGSFSASGDNTILKPSRKLLICNWWLISRDTGAANVKLKKSGGNDITAVMAKGTNNDAVVNPATTSGTIIAAEDELLASDTLVANLSAAQAVDVFVLCKVIG